MGTVSAPSGGLKSSSNYFITSNGNPLTGLKLTVDVTEDIVAAYGFSIQMNCYPVPGGNVTWQQYGFAFNFDDAGTPQLGWFINNWCTTGFDNVPKGGDLINNRAALQSLTGPVPRLGPTVAAHYKFIVVLGNDSVSKEINSANFTIIDPSGRKWQTGTIDLDSLFVDHSNPKLPIGASAMSAIAAFQVDIVGKINSEYSYLWSGAGTITYQAATPLSATGATPPNVVRITQTGETSNVGYGPLQDGSSLSVQQSFATFVPPAYLPGGSLAVSPRIGANQTDVFGVDRAGQIVVFSVQGGGHWTSSLPISPFCWAKPGAFLAASQQFGANNQTNVFVVAQNSHLSTFWSENGGGWNGPVDIGALLNVDTDRHTHSGAALAVSQRFGVPDQTDVFLVDKTGVLNVYSVKAAGSWTGPVLLGAAGSLPEAAPIAVGQQFGAPNQTDVFVVDETGTLQVFSVESNHPWSPSPTPVGPVGHFKTGARLVAAKAFDAGNQTNIYGVDKSGQISMFSAQGTGGWSAAPVLIGPQDLAPAGAPLAVAERQGVPGWTDLYIVDKSGTLNLFSKPAGGSWSAGETIGPAGIAPSSAEDFRGVFIAASPQYGAAGQTDVFLVNETGTNGPGWPTVFWVEGAGAWNGPKALVTEV